MSTYVAKAFNPVSKRIEDATYIDDYYGRHKYGIRFDDGCVHPYAQCGLDAAATALTAKDKEIEALRERVQDLWQNPVRCAGCGSSWTNADLAVEKANNPKLLSCCPERKPLNIDEWKARAETAERRVAELEGSFIAATKAYDRASARAIRLQQELDEARAALKPMASLKLRKDKYPDDPDVFANGINGGTLTPDHVRAARAVINKGE